jgi:very-short-patch-repair endonuclease
LGYWLDYINFDLKVIIEWDEKRHYDASGNLKERDIRRQEEIQEYFPDFLFLRIREEKFQRDDVYKTLRRFRRKK